MKTVDQINQEIEKQKEEMEVLIIRRDRYLRENNDAGIDAMNDGLIKVLAKINCLKWVLSDS